MEIREPADRTFFFGSKKLFCSGCCISGPDTRRVVVTFCLIFVPVVVFVIWSAPWFVEKLGWTIPVIIVSEFAIATAFLFKTACSDPGIVPRQRIHPVISRCMKSGTEVDITPSYRQQDLVIHGHNLRFKYCYTCNIYRPPRTVHCSVCDNCVERFDHHCPWMGNCIGIRNYRFFFAFMFVIVIMSLSMVAASSTRIAILTVFLKNGMTTDSMSVFIGLWSYGSDAMLLLLYSFVTSWFVTGLFLYHVYLIVLNQTTYEQIKSFFDESSNPWDRGAWKNLLDILFRQQRKRYFDASNPVIRVLNEDSVYDLNGAYGCSESNSLENIGYIKSQLENNLSINSVPSSIDIPENFPTLLPSADNSRKLTNDGKPETFIHYRQTEQENGSRSFLSNPNIDSVPPSHVVTHTLVKSSNLPNSNVEMSADINLKDVDGASGDMKLSQCDDFQSRLNAHHSKNALLNDKSIDDSKNAMQIFTPHTSTNTPSRGSVEIRFEEPGVKIKGDKMHIEGDHDDGRSKDLTPRVETQSNRIFFSVRSDRQSYDHKHVATIHPDEPKKNVNETDISALQKTDSSHSKPLCTLTSVANSTVERPLAAVSSSSFLNCNVSNEISSNDKQRALGLNKNGSRHIVQAKEKGALRNDLSFDTISSPLHSISNSSKHVEEVSLSSIAVLNINKKEHLDFKRILKSSVESFENVDETFFLNSSVDSEISRKPKVFGEECSHSFQGPCTNCDDGQFTNDGEYSNHEQIIFGRNEYNHFDSKASFCCGLPLQMINHCESYSSEISHTSPTIPSERNSFTSDTVPRVFGSIVISLMSPIAKRLYVLPDNP